MRAAAPDTLAAPAQRLRAVASRHRAMTITLALAIVVHGIAYVAFFPALFFPDSFTYLQMGFDPVRNFVDVNFSRPSGYPLFLAVLKPVTGATVWPFALIQQGLAVLAGALVYALLHRLGTPTWLSIGAAALVLFDAYVIVVAQMMLGETLMMVLVVTALAIVALLPEDRRWGTARAIGLGALAGGLIGYGVTVRTATMFVLPVVLVYLLWSRKGWAVALALTVGFLAPTLGYLAAHDKRTGMFSFTQADGWFLYARIGKIGTCGDAAIPANARVLCAQMEDPPPGVHTHLWGGADSPAHRAFGVGPQTGIAYVNDALKDFAVAIIKDRPIVYARMVGRDVVRYFEPGVFGDSGTDRALRPDYNPIGYEKFRQPAFDEWAPQYRTDGTTLFVPRGPIDAYGRWLHTPRWLLGIGTLLACLAVAAAIVLRRRFALEHRREAFLLLGAGLALVVGATATSAFVLRYLMPALPLLWAGIALVLSDVLALRRRASEVA